MAGPGEGTVSRLTLLGGLLLAAAAVADPPGRFDYYLLSLSWSPQYCAAAARGDEPQCARPYAFVAHGLWPQNEHGYPRECRTRERVSESTIDHMLPLMPSRGLVIHEWRTHGACSGLGAEDYFAAVERAYRSVHVPSRYSAVADYLSVDAAQLKQDFVSANPGLDGRDLAISYSGHYLQEVRVCLDRELRPRECGTDVRDRCGGSVVLRPVR